MNIAASIMANLEGGTASLDGSPLPTDGYFVGGIVSALVFPSPIRFTPDAIWNLQVFTNYLRTTVGARFVGWWTDEETGQLWIDGTTWTSNYNHAEQLCEERGEIAFYDVARQQEIRP